MKRPVVRLLFAGAIMCALAVTPVHGALVPVTGQNEVVWRSYSGTTSSVTFDVGYGPVSTGEISYHLDTSYGSDNYTLFEWDAGTVSNRMHILVSCPLMETLGESPIALTVDETGQLDSIPLVDPDLGPGVVQELEVGFTASYETPITQGLFAGFTYSNCDEGKGYIKGKAKQKPGEKPELELEIGVEFRFGMSNDGFITDPGGNQQPTSGQSEATVTAVSEPTTVTIWIALAGLGMIATRRRRKAA